MADATFVHPFERAGLGIAPFRFIGHVYSYYQACHGAPIQPGGACDYCGQGIYDQFQIQSADGRKFKVGCDCVRKTYAKGDRVLTEVEEAAKKAIKQRRSTQIATRVAALRIALDADPSLYRDRPHPTDYRAARGETLRDQIEWLLKNAGETGRAKLVKSLGF